MQYFNEQSDMPAKKKRSTKTEETINAPRTPADDFHDQVERYYKLPKQPYKRTGIKFSPSGVTKCTRELYYQNTNAPCDNNPILTPWKQRVPRNGEGVHAITQRDYVEMHKKLITAGEECKFMMVETEQVGKAEFEIDGVTVVLSGRCDGILVDRQDVYYIYEKKTKDKLKNLKKLKEPQSDHKWQVVSYSLIFGIPRTIFEIESLQKPEWSKDEDEDQKHFYFESTPEMEEALLHRLASVVKAIKNHDLPTQEFDKCMFCQYKEQCRKDG